MKIDSLSSQLSQTQKKLNNIFQQLSTGKRINSAKDDPATLAIAQGLLSSENSYKTANSNISLAQGALEIASGSLSQTTEQLQGLRELAVQAANGTLSDADRANLQQQFDQGLSTIDDIAKRTNFNGKNLLDGSFDESIQTGGDSGNTHNVSLGNVSTSALGLSSSGIATQDAASDALAAIDNALAQVNSQAASVGAYQNTLDFTSEANDVSRENIAAARSQAEDADLAETTANLTKQQILQQSQIAVAKLQQESSKLLYKKFLG